MTAHTQLQNASLELAKTFYEAKGRHDLDATMALFAEDAVYVLPLSASGDPQPWFVHDGKDKVAQYQQNVLTRFSQIRMLDPEFTVSPDGGLVFVTARGDYVQADGNTPYHNVYVFRFQIRDGKIVRVDEYANPVTYAKLAGLPIG